MSACIFCEIAKHNIPAQIVWEDDLAMAFLDINPNSPGHTLIIPKEHYAQLEVTPDQALTEIFSRVKKFRVALKQAMKADYIVISIAGNDVDHLHIHLIPRHKNDGLVPWPQQKYLPGQAEEIIKQINNSLNQL